MKESRNRRPIFSVCFCMLAVVLVYAPFAAAAFSALGMPCCAGSQCPISGHHHGQTAPTSDDSADCDHGMGTGMTACSMSCCRTTDHALPVPFAFLLPAPATLIALADGVRGVSTLKEIALPGSLEPVSPPPRLAVL